MLIVLEVVGVGISLLFKDKDQTAFGRSESGRN